ncbi:MAG: NAD(P)H-hydrate dehydratase [Candidatus Aenigmatarchaeota archaeon]|nr:MAG: NAD(P)H-hydrate dehydratase [Candidatus Aenigmarchaeota archaeon]
MVEVIKELRKIYKKREKEVHKYNFGSLLVIGGSKIYSGSPTFNALAALRSGVDLVEIAAPERAANIIASFSPDLITHPLKGDFLKKEHLKQIYKILENKTGFVIGGGLGREKETFKAVQKFLSEAKLPGVIDADAIYAVAEKPEIVREKNFVLTPHAYEFFILSGERVLDDLERRKNKVIKVARELKTTILLKGNIDIISDGNKIYLNKTGTPYMTKGGTGDTLAGICGALLARKVNCFESACCAAYINGRAGELASKKFRESFLASDLLNEIPKVINY